MAEIKLTYYQLSQLADMVAEKMLAKLDTRKLALPSEKKFTAKEAAEYLKMSLSTLYHLGDEIPHIKIGRKSLYTEEALYNYIHK